MSLILSRPKHVACALPPSAADLLGFLPADWLALGALAACSTLSGGAPCIGSTAGWAGGALEWLPLLRLLHLARLYRLRQLFSYLVRAAAAFSRLSLAGHVCTSEYWAQYTYCCVY